jgi:hypothetical protein
MEGKEQGVALALGRRLKLEDGATPQKVFQASFRAPQSFRFLTEVEKTLLSEWIER